MTILVVDDEPMLCELIKTLLEVRGFRRILTVGSAKEAWSVLNGRQVVDLVLTDINMPEVSGYELLTALKRHEHFRMIPVIAISGVGRFEAVVRCIRHGAEEFLTKPIEKELLWARVWSSLERKHLRDVERELLYQIELEKQRSEALLFNVMPRRIAHRMRAGERHIAELFENVSVLFMDMTGFTPFAARMSPERLVGLLNELFLFFDNLVEEFQLEKIKTIGDNYMVCGGINDEGRDHVERAVGFARAAILGLQKFNGIHDIDLALRVGIHAGPVVAGIIGHKRPMFDMWGETVNIASRMESHGLPNRIQISESAFAQLPKRSGFEPRGVIDVKGKGEMTTYLSPVYVQEEERVR